MSDTTGRFWLIVRDPGMVPDRKGPFVMADTAKVLREFMAANPNALIDYLTVGPDGTPDVEHGPMVLQYTDGRSMSVARRHNARVRSAEALPAEIAKIAAKLTQAQRTLVVASDPDDTTGEEGTGVDISGPQYRTAKCLERLGVGAYTHGSFIADMYWNNGLGLAVRDHLERKGGDA